MCLFKVKGGKRCSRNALLPVNKPRYCQEHFATVILDHANKIVMKGGELPPSIKDALIYIKGKEYYRKHPDAGWERATIDGKQYLVTDSPSIIANVESNKKVKSIKGTVITRASNNKRTAVRVTKNIRPAKKERGPELFPPALNNPSACCYMNAAMQFIYHIKEVRDFLIEHIKDYPRNAEYRQDAAALMKAMRDGSQTNAKDALDEGFRDDTIIRSRDTLGDIQDNLIGVFDERDKGNVGTQRDALEFITLLFDKILPTINTSSNDYEYVDQMYIGQDLKKTYYYIMGYLDYTIRRFDGRKECTTPRADPVTYIPIKTEYLALSHISSSTEDIINYLLTKKDATSKCPEDVDEDLIGSCPAKRGRKIKTCENYAMSNENEFIIAGLSAFELDGSRTKNLRILISRSFTTEEGAKYNLTAIVVHKGYNRNSGHYVCIKKIGGSWYEYDDIKDVKRIGVNEYLDYNSNVSRSTPYIMLYERV